MTALARDWDAAALGRHSRLDELTEAVQRSGTLLREPATEEEIAAGEQRLGVQFPPSYRMFLLVSNGAWNTFPDPDLRFLPVAEVRPFREVDAGVVHEWTREIDTTDPDLDVPFGDVEEAVACYTRMRDALFLGGEYDCRHLLVPRPGAVEWEVWDHEKEGATGYRSFADMLRLQAERDRCFTPVAEGVDTYLARARAGDHEGLWDLAEFDGERALAATADLLDEGGTYRTMIGDARLLNQLARSEGRQALRDRAEERGRQPLTRLFLLTAAAAEGPERASARAALQDHLVQIGWTQALAEDLLGEFPK